MSEPALAYHAPEPARAEGRERTAAPLDGVGGLDAAARLDMLMQAYEEPAMRAGTMRPTKAMWFARARFALACAMLAVLIGGAAGTLSSLSTF